MPFMNMWMREGYAEGYAAGRLKARQDGVLTVLRFKFRRVNKPVKEQISRLSFRQLGTLLKAAIHFNHPDELSQWLRKRVPQQPLIPEANDGLPQIQGVKNGKSN